MSTQFGKLLPAVDYTPTASGYYNRHGAYATGHKGHSRACDYPEQTCVCDNGRLSGGGKSVQLVMERRKQQAIAHGQVWSTALNAWVTPPKPVVRDDPKHGLPLTEAPRLPGQLGVLFLTAGALALGFGEGFACCFCWAVALFLFLARFFSTMPEYKPDAKQLDYEWLMGPEPPLLTEAMAGRWPSAVPEAETERLEFFLSWPDPMEKVDPSYIEAALNGAWSPDPQPEVQIVPQTEQERDARLIEKVIEADPAWGLKQQHNRLKVRLRETSDDALRSEIHEALEWVGNEIARIEQGWEHVQIAGYVGGEWVNTAHPMPRLTTKATSC